MLLYNRLELFLAKPTFKENIKEFKTEIFDKKTI